MAHVDIALGANYSLTSSTHLWADAQIADTALPDEIEADGGRLNLFSVADWTGFNVAACRVEFSVAGLVTAEAIDSLYFRLTVGSQSVDSPRFPHEKDATGPRYSATLTPSDGAVYTEWLAWIKAARLLFPLVTTTGTLRVQDGPFASGSITNKIATLSETATHDFNAGSLDPADGDVTWQVKSGGGSITNAGVYTPLDVSANRAVTVALLVNGTEVDTVSFTVTPVFLPTISNKITTLAETATHDFNIANAAQATGTLGWRVKAGSVGTIDSDGVYGIGTDAVDVRTDTPVTVELIDTSGSTVTVRDSDTFVVTPVFTGTISNKIATLEETDTHDFDATGVSGPGDPVTWRVNSGGGSITNAGHYTPPDVPANRTVKVALLVGGREVDTDTFTVNVVHTPVQSTQYGYQRAAAAPALPTPGNQRSVSNPPSGWSANDQAATTALDVYRISRTITRLNGVFQSGDTDWAWDPATQPGTPYRLRLPTTRTEYAYLRGTSRPTLPTSTAEAIPAGWTTSQLAATTDAHVYRIRRAVNERQGAFVSASSWVFDPTAQPWRQARTTTDTQYAYRAAETLDEAAGLPSSTAAALPSGWVAQAPARTEEAGNWRIARTRTLRLGAFVSATAWAWNPVYAQQPWQRALAGLSDTVRKWVTTVRHIASGALAQVVWTVQAEAIFDGSVDGYGIEEAYALFPSSVLAADGTLTIPASQQPLNTWTYDQLSQASVTLGGITWTDGPTAPTADSPVRVKALRRVPGQPSVGAAPTDRWSDWAWYPDVVRPEDGDPGADGRYPAKELDVYLVVNAPASGGTTPATPIANSYRFADDVLVGLTQSWVRTRPLSIADGQLVYCATVSAQDPGTGIDTSIAFSVPVVCNDVLDIDIVYRRYPTATTSVARPANTAHNAIATGWYARPGLIPSNQTGVLWECVRYLKVSGDNIRWEHDDPYRAVGPDGRPGKAGTGERIRYHGRVADIHNPSNDPPDPGRIELVPAPPASAFTSATATLPWTHYTSLTGMNLTVVDDDGFTRRAYYEHFLTLDIDTLTIQIDAPEGPGNARATHGQWVEYVVTGRRFVTNVDDESTTDDYVEFDLAYLEQSADPPLENIERRAVYAMLFSATAPALSLSNTGPAVFEPGATAAQTVRLEWVRGNVVEESVEIDFSAPDASNRISIAAARNSNPSRVTTVATSPFATANRRSRTMRYNGVQQTAVALASVQGEAATVVTLTEAEYNALTTPDPDTLYLIKR